MSKTAFKEFIKQERAVDSRRRSIDWEGKKRTYLKRVNVLFNKIRTYLHEFVESGELQLTETKETIKEDYIGEYEVPVLRIQLCGKRADLVPVGTNIIGTPGRVDLRGSFDSVRLILADKEEKNPQPFVGISWVPIDKKRARKKTEELMTRKCNYVWKIITDPPDIRYIKLNEDRFLTLLQEMLDG